MSPSPSLSPAPEVPVANESTPIDTPPISNDSSSNPPPPKKAVIVEEVDSDEEPQDGDSIDGDDSADKKGKGKEKEVVTTIPTDEDIEKRIAAAMAGAEGSTSATAAPTHDWQAVWSAPQNAYYFYNIKTMETTWVNPLVSPSTNPSSSQPQAEASATAGGSSPVWDPSAETLPSSSNPSASTSAPLTSYQKYQQQFSYGPQSHPSSSAPTPSSSQQSIDPSLSHLLPPSFFNPSDPSSSYTAQARFNTRTGRYENPNPTALSSFGAGPEYLSDVSKMKRQNQAFFDQEAWEREREEAFELEQQELAAGGAAGGKRKRNTKADVARFREKKEAKKMMRNSWLRS